LIAFLALYVTASGRSLWKLIRCLLHFTFSSRTPPDGIYLQRQTTLRNTPLALDAALELLEIWRVWRKKAAKTDNRLLVVALIALLSAMGFIAAGTYDIDSV
jgi:hypothetical protein